MSKDDIDIESVMAGIRQKVREDLKNGRPTVPGFRPSSPAQSGSAASTIVLSPELQYLNAHWCDWLQAEEPPVSHRPVLGKIVLGAKNFVIQTVWKYIFGKYFERERVYQHNIVRFLNETAYYVDRRDSEVFDHLFQKIDADIKALNERMDRLFDLAASENLALQDEVRELQAAAGVLSTSSRAASLQGSSRSAR